MKKLGITLVLLVMLILGTGVEHAAPVEKDFSCTPSAVAVRHERIAVLCYETVPDGNSTISWWAVSTSDAEWADRFLSVATTALVSGRILDFRYTVGDTSGVSFGCLANDCRTPTRIVIR
jgi:hypothetical protein